MNEPICAIASAYGRSAIGVIRLSGSNSHKILQSIFKPFSKNIQSLTEHPGKTILGSILWKNSFIDEVIVISFNSPKSYTGEDSVEIHAHGNPLILEKILNILYKIGFRPAQPGEFTKRAFLSGKLDITQAEAVNEIITSKSIFSLQSALRMKQGRFRSMLLQFRSDLLNLVADSSAELDFIDEGIHFSEKKEKSKILNDLILKVHSLLEVSKSMQIYRNGMEIVILGAPNVGKSSLLNYLYGRERAIVSSIPGTTRDFIEAEIILDGIPVRFVDTAGIRIIKDKNSHSSIEKLGVEKSLEKAAQANMILFLLDTSLPFKKALEEAPIQELQKQVKHSEDIKVFTLLNKLDIMHFSWKNGFALPEIFQNFMQISLVEQKNMDKFIKKFKKMVISKKSDQEGILLSAWQVEIFEQILEILKEALELITFNAQHELFVSTLQISLNLIGQLTGNISNEEILGRIFSRFCIGK